MPAFLVLLWLMAISNNESDWKVANSNDSRDSSGILAVCVIVIVTFIIGGFAGWIGAVRSESSYWQRVCIEHGIAEYDRVTGEWKLIEKPEGE